MNLYQKLFWEVEKNKIETKFEISNSNIEGRLQ